MTSKIGKPPEPVAPRTTSTVAPAAVAPTAAPRIAVDQFRTAPTGQTIPVPSSGAAAAPELPTFMPPEFSRLLGRVKASPEATEQAKQTFAFLGKPAERHAHPHGVEAHPTAGGVGAKGSEVDEHHFDVGEKGAEIGEKGSGVDEHHFDVGEKGAEIGEKGSGVDEHHFDVGEKGAEIGEKGSGVDEHHFDVGEKGAEIGEKGSGVDEYGSEIGEKIEPATRQELQKLLDASPGFKALPKNQQAALKLFLDLPATEESARTSCPRR